MVALRFHRKPVAVVFALLLPAAFADAAVTARVDRPSVEQNESFTLELVVDTNLDSQPDLSVLEADFHIGQTSHLSDTRVFNGEIRRSRRWQIALMAKRAGTLTIPPIAVGNQQSNALTVTVREPSQQPPGEADVFITAEVDRSDTYVQAQVLYKIKIYRAVTTRQPALREPSITGAEVIVELAGDERNYEAVINDRAYSVIEKAFALYPQESGEVLISPARFEARVLRNGRITGRKVFESESQVITVRPIPPAPAEFPNAAWLPARDVTLNDDWSREPDRLRAGEPISRNITISALGQLETQIPVIEPPTVAGVNVYPDKPSLNRRYEADGIRGVRTDQYAMIGSAAGDIVMPEIELPWWDIEAGEWRVARVPERAVTILPSPDAPPPEPVVAATAEAAGAEADGPAATVVHSDFWRLVAQILGAVWVLTLMGWWWSTRPRREERPAAPVPVHRQQSKALKAARRAAIDGDARGVREGVLEWARLEWPDSPPRSVGELAARVTSPLSDELRGLSAVSYGPGHSNWDGQSLAKALRSFAVIGNTAVADDDPLPPLMPATKAGI